MSLPQETDHQSTSKTGSLLAPPTLRPRAKRFLSGFEDFTDGDSEARDTIGSPFGTPGGSPVTSRAASPIPSKHPSRSSSSRPTRPPARTSHSSPSVNGANLGPDLGSDLAASFAGLWGKSWTNLQSIASNVLGSDATQALYKDKAPRTKRPYEATHSKDRSPVAWGPRDRGESQPGGGSKEERAAKVRAEKRKELLASGGSYGDAKSRTKRRTSDDFESASAPPGDHDDRDALVYIHQVQPLDTLAGISIKYNTQMPVIKKSNRLWSNDGVQFRKALMLPIDSCGLKGRPVAAPTVSTPDLLSSDDNVIVEEDPKTLNLEPGPSPALRPKSSSAVRPKREQNGHTRQNSSQSGSLREEALWQHDSWVLLEGHSIPTEIARIPRRELGYFPRSRRRSLAYSDFESPATSLDLPRSSNAASDATAAPKGHRPRRSSSANQWAQQMIGPGGVGKLNSKGVSVPGPALDKLNKTFSKHLPSVSPSDRDMPAGLQLEQLGGAIEGWVRNISKTAAKLVEAPAPSSKIRRQTGITSGSGDLIELDNSFEAADDDLPDPDNFEDFDERERGRSRGSTMVTSSEDYGHLLRARVTAENSQKKKGE